LLFVYIFLPTLELPEQDNWNLGTFSFQYNLKRAALNLIIKISEGVQGLWLTNVFRALCQQLITNTIG